MKETTELIENAEKRLVDVEKAFELLKPVMVTPEQVQQFQGMLERHTQLKKQILAKQVELITGICQFLAMLKITEIKLRHDEYHCCKIIFNGTPLETSILLRICFKNGEPEITNTLERLAESYSFPFKSFFNQILRAIHDRLREISGGVKDDLKDLTAIQSELPALIARFESSLSSVPS